MTFFTEQKPDRMDGWVLLLKQATQQFRQTRCFHVAWKKEFALIQEKPDRIEEVLKWYCDNIGKDYTPTAFTAQAFNRKFRQIEMAMMRTRKSSIAISPEMERLSKSLMDSFKFPPEVLIVLPQIAQVTDTNWQEFDRRMANYMMSQSDRDCNRDIRFIQHVRCFFSPCFTEMWLIHISKSIGRLENYSGDPMKLVFTKDSEKFKERWKMWSYGWSTVADTFDRLLAELIK